MQTPHSPLSVSGKQETAITAMNSSLAESIAELERDFVVAVVPHEPTPRTQEDAVVVPVVEVQKEVRYRSRLHIPCSFVIF